MLNISIPYFINKRCLYYTWEKGSCLPKIIQNQYLLSVIHPHETWRFRINLITRFNENWKPHYKHCHIDMEFG